MKLKVEEGEWDVPLTAEEYNHHVWDIIGSYFEENRGLQSQAIASYNRFLLENIPNIVGTCGHTSVEDTHNSLYKTVHCIQLTNTYFERRVIEKTVDGAILPLYPHEARMRHLTYSSPLSVDVVHTIKNVDVVGYETIVKEETISKFLIAEIPIMVKSQFCSLNGMTEAQLSDHHEDPNDPGGYFIINGKEKVIVTQERPANNKLFLFKPMCDSQYQFECEVRSTVDSTTHKVAALWIHIPGNPKSYKTFRDTRSSATQPKFRSLRGEASRRTLQRMYAKTHPGLIVTIARVRGTVPLIILFKALGFITDKEIWETLLVRPEDGEFFDAMRSTMENKDSCSVKTQKEALIYIGARSINESVSLDEVMDHGTNLIREEVLPALGPDEDRIKGYHLGYMTNRLIFAYLGRIPCDDRDHLQNKRFELAGPMLATLFRSQIKNLMNECKLAISRRLRMGLSYNVQTHIIRHKHVTRGLLYSMTTGNWGDKRRGSTCRVGVVQLLNRLTAVATLSYLRRINSPVNRLVRMTAPRQVHTTGFGYICPADTPEGETVGLLKALSLMAEISKDYDKQPIQTSLESFGYDSIEELHRNPGKLRTDIKIFINEEIMGTCRPDRATQLLQALKYSRMVYDEYKEERRDEYGMEDYLGFSNQVSITLNQETKEIKIRTDGGRGFRPLLVVKDNQLVLNRMHLQRLLNPEDTYGWKDLIKDGVVEYLDTAESETAMIAMFPRDLIRENHKTYITRSTSTPISYNVTFTHCEIHPSMILGVCASLIPYPDHNQSPRNTYQSGMAKQALGVYHTNFYYRGDPESHILHYPQRPLVTTQPAKFCKYDESPAGANAIVAICCYTGYNQEDSVILNRSSVQRGLFRSTLFRTTTDEAKVNHGRGDMDETFEIPRRGEVVTFRSAEYRNLDKDGFPSPGSEIRDGFGLIGKTQCLVGADLRKVKRKSTRHLPKCDVSTIFHASAASGGSYVDSVLITNSPDNYRMVKVKVRTPRNPQIGDKFASRHGQKGVVGFDFPETELPFTKDGIVPDLILNPHAIPSRMTIGHLLETLEAKRATFKGERSDGTAFTGRLSVEEIGKQLAEFGYQKHGMEVMYEGGTGRKIASQIFIGPVFYQRLKHMTEDKIHMRERGPVTQLCKQPTAGLQNNGGLRFGEMERDSTIAHGAASFLRERLFTVSDYYSLPVCRRCGSFLSRPSKERGAQYIFHLKCRVCNDSSAAAATVEIPFACKLFFQELMSMNIRVLIEPQPISHKVVPKKAARDPPVADPVSMIVAEMNAYEREEKEFEQEDDEF